MAETQPVQYAHGKPGMTRGAVIIALLTSVLLLVSISCKTSTSSNLRNLSGAEKEIAIQIALDAPEAKDLLNKGYTYKADLNWVGIVWRFWKVSEFWALDYDVWEKGTPPNLPRSAVIYPRVDLYFGEPQEVLLRVAVDLSTEKVVFVDGHPLKKLPS